MVFNPIRRQEFDVPYGIASAILTTGDVAISTVGAYYHGLSLISGLTSTAIGTIYDNASTTSGNVIDTFMVSSASPLYIDKQIPVVAKNGLYISIAGEGASGAIFYAPKG